MAKTKRVKSVTNNKTGVTIRTTTVNNSGGLLSGGPSRQVIKERITQNSFGGTKQVLSNKTFRKGH